MASHNYIPDLYNFYIWTILFQFYEEVIYAENGPGEEAYKKYYESIDPATAEYLYKQVVQQVEESNEVKEYAQAYSEMKPQAED